MVLPSRESVERITHFSRSAKVKLKTLLRTIRTLYKILHICRNVFIFDALFLAIQGEGIAAKDDADALEQAGIYSLAFENVIYIGAVAMEAMGKPRNATPLTAQLSFNLFTDVYWHSSTNISRNGSLVAAL